MTSRKFFRVTFSGWRLIVRGMETTLLMVVALAALLVLSWYLMNATKRTRGAGSWLADRLLIWLSGASAAIALEVAVHLVFHLLG